MKKMEDFKEVKKPEVVCSWVQDEDRSRLCYTMCRNIYFVEKMIDGDKEITVEKKIAIRNSLSDFMILKRKLKESKLKIKEFIQTRKHEIKNYTGIDM